MSFDSFFQDVRFALRSFRRAPLFTAGVVGTIAIGIGITCAVFTVFNGYVLRPFAVRDPHGLYEFGWINKSQNYQSFGWRDFERFRNGNAVYSEALATTAVSPSLDGRMFPGHLVTGNYFSMLGVQAAIGRVLRPFDEGGRGETVIVLSNSAWTTRFGTDPGIIGRRVPLSGHTFEIIGVAPPDFSGLAASTFDDPSPDFWAPITTASYFDSRGQLSIVGRLRSGTNEQRARVGLELEARNATADLAESDQPINFVLRSRATPNALTPRLVAAFTVILFIFSLVLMIACANVSNMMLARVLSRQREIAVRISLGAGRRRLVRQLLTESIVLSIPAAALAFVFASISARFAPQFLVSSILPPEFSSAFRVPSLDPDLRVFIFGAGVTICTAIVFGLLPAIQASRVNLTDATRGDFGANVRPGRVRDLLVIAQVSLCVMFLVCAGLLLRGSRQLAQRDTHMDLARVADVQLPESVAPRILERLKDQPWVETRATAWRTPLYGDLRTAPVILRSVAARVGYNFVSPEYFATLGIAVKQGRNFTDAENRSDAPVVILSKATAQRFWPNQNPVGQLLETGRAEVDRRDERVPHAGRFQVIGVAEDVIGGLVQDGIDRTRAYFPLGPSPERHAVLLRFRGSEAEARRRFAAVVEEIAPRVSWSFVPLDQVAAVSLSPFRAAFYTAWLLGFLALILTLSGIYGVLSYLVSQRTQEIGVRMALGASAGAVLRSILRRALMLTGIGSATGVAFALAISAVMASRVEMVDTFDWQAYLGSVSLIVPLALTSAYFPSRRGSRVDPVVALRAE